VKKKNNIDILFDYNLIRESIKEITKNKKIKSEELRNSVLVLLKDVILKSKKESEKKLFDHGSGTQCARSFSIFQDEIIKIISDFAIFNVNRSQNSANNERIAFIAVGGYGRGTLAPFSDIDLLFLYPDKLTPWAESVIEFTLYMLWDLGFKIGHASRNIDQSIGHAKSDFTIRTSILEARFIWGDSNLFNNLIDKFNTEIVAKTADEFIEMKLIERDKRHEVFGSSRYLIEPNIKESKGGLRDLHTLFWIGKYLYRPNKRIELIEKGLLTRSEFRRFEKAEDFLWAIRCHLHFIANRDDELLSFDRQPQLAVRLGYSERPGQKHVERFMKHYFLIAKEVGDLTRIVCSVLEENSVKKEPVFKRMLETLNIRKESKNLKNGFSIERNRLRVESDLVFKDNPINLIKLFHIADTHNVLLSSELVQNISRSLYLINKDLINNKEANGLFLEILTSPRDPESILRQMNETGVLGKFIPEFGKIVCMTQFNLYHHYTVDEHLLRTTGFVSDMKHNKLKDPHPISNALIQKIDNLKILYVAAFLHDIAKGGKQDHSIKGAVVANQICKRFGMNQNETDIVSWLIRNHLVMSDMAQKRDLYDSKTISDFVGIVGTTEKLRYLLALTVADIMAVGPTVWNGWKNGLLITLYQHTEMKINENKHSRTDQKEKVSVAKKLFIKSTNNWGKGKINQYIKRFNESYWTSSSLEIQLEHASLITNADIEQITINISSKTNPSNTSTQITLIAPDYPNLLSTLAGACSLSDANIVDAHIETTTDGLAIDTIFINRDFGENDENRRAKKIANTIEKSLKGALSLETSIAKKNYTSKLYEAFDVKTNVIVTNKLSNHLTVIEIEGRDRPGLLYDITKVLQKANINIKSAHIATFGERAIDVFYVCDLFGYRISSAEKRKRIEDMIRNMLEENNA
jgi:[protein-PII] uridylyltransferase|tara:strand:+ start:19120 stop:21876 length:2757 start_codon:yes stop_codon:yes gene_type:complete